MMLTLFQEVGSVENSFASMHLEQLQREGRKDDEEIEMLKQASFTMYAGT